MKFQIIDLATLSPKLFFFFVNKCNDSYRSGRDLILYKEVISMHRKTGDLEALLSNESFCLKAYETLVEWGMNKRRAELDTFENFMKSIRANKEDLARLYKYKLHDDLAVEMNTIARLLENVFCNLSVMQSKRRIVGVSKALHFLIPDLVMPIDNRYIMPAFFYGDDKYSDDPHKEFQTYYDIFKKTFQIAKKLELTPSDADGDKWKTSVPKLIDNSIIGLFNSEVEEVRSLLLDKSD